MDLEKLLNELDEKDIDEFINGFIKEENEWKWRNEGDFLIFLNEMVEYLKENKSLNSETFLYDEKENHFTSKKEYVDYLESLINKIYSYCDKYKLNLINDSVKESLFFNDLCVLLKHKDKLYLIERLYGQGTLDIISIYDGKEDNYILDYDDIINDNPPKNHKEILKSKLEVSLSKFKEHFQDELDILNLDIILAKK